MEFSFATAAIVFGLIFVVELPDKTFIATLVLATRFRPLLVWIGVTAAFLVQTVVAVLLGGLLARLPRTPVEVFATIMFLIGGFLLLRGAADADKEELKTVEEFSHKGAATAHGLKVIATSFMVLFLAEWGDLSQLLTASLVIKYDDPVSVGVGAFAALAAVSGLGAVIGRILLKRRRLSTIRLVGGGVCLLLAAVSTLQIAGVLGG